jgi:hypothetical protein
MPPVHSVKEVPTWAAEKPAPHFGKPSGLAPGSWKQSEIMERISETRHWATRMKTFFHPGRFPGLSLFQSCLAF